MKEHLAIVRMLQDRLRTCRDALSDAQQATTEAHERLTELAKERRTLERLSEKMRAEHEAASTARAVKTADDMVTVRIASQRSRSDRNATV